MTYIALYILKVIALLICACIAIMILVILLGDKEKRDSLFKKWRR